MVIVHLARHWLARRHYPFASWSACIARSLRVLLFYRDHARLLALGIYRDHLVQVHDDVFHHLSHRDYLAKGLSLAQRVRCVATHYRFEEATFDAAYQRAVYRDGGLVLWRHEPDLGTEGGVDGRPVEIRLQMASRLNAEGDLTLILLAGGTRLHRLLDGCRGPADLGPQIVPGLFAAEADYLLRHEWAQCGADILWRRTKLGLHAGAGAEALVDAWIAARATDAPIGRLDQRMENSA